MKGPLRIRAATLLGLAAVVLASSLQGCALLREMGAVRQLDFSLEGVTDVRLAGVELDRVQRFEDLGGADLIHLGRVFSEGELPLSLTLRVRADNPDDNPRARITALQWDLRLRDRETVSGALDDEVVVEPGEAAEVPLTAQVDLVRFFEGSLRDLAAVAMALARAEPTGDDLQLRVRPEVRTRLGSVQYPSPLVLSPG